MHLLVNPATRRGSTHADIVATALTNAGRRVMRISPSGVDDIVPALERAAPERVVAVGGDGLVHRSLPALAGSDIVLGIVPSGTGNDFARSLGLPRRRRAAIARSIGRDRAIDVLRVGFADGTSALAATVVTAGFSGRVNETANARSFPRGQLKYTAASLIELRRLRPLDLDIAEAPALSGPCAFVAVANTPHFGGGMSIVPHADPTDGRLAITVVGEVPAWQLALVLPSVFVGQHIRHPRVVTASTPKATVDQVEDVWADGERIGVGPFTVEVMPSGLRVAAF